MAFPPGTNLRSLCLRPVHRRVTDHWQRRSGTRIWV